jgi:hypothetical protein
MTPLLLKGCSLGAIFFLRALILFWRPGQMNRGQQITDNVITDRKRSEFGSHQDLMKAGGRYSQLFELQAAGYR